MRMSPASRGRRRKRNQRTSGRADLRLVQGGGGLEECDCPVCSGEDVDGTPTFDEVFDGIGGLAASEDPIDAEWAGAAFVAMATATLDERARSFVQGFVSQVEAKRNTDAVAVLLAINSVATGVEEEIARAAWAAAHRLVAAGIPAPPSAGELTERVKAGDCMRLYDAQETTSVLFAAFHRAGHAHGFIVVVDEQDCGAASEIGFLDTGDAAEVLDDLRKAASNDGVELRTQVLDPAELRWYAEQALDARAVHDNGQPFDEMFDEEEGPPYPILALLLRARLAALPEARRPAGARGRAHADQHAATMLDKLASMGVGGGFGGLRLGPVAPGQGRTPSRLPARRKKSDGPAPIYQIKVGLRGAKPPIWRRLLVPANASLTRLHRIIQAAFGWNDSHIHVFETPYGAFGQPDPELGHRSEAAVTLEQVAQRAKDKISYTYDFGDDWTHDIVVEQVLDPDPSLTYPVCTGGRRAAPPDDCGGIWGYQELVEILTDPSHPDHRERLAWFGLSDAGQFDPAAFNVDDVNRALAKQRR